jgi:hypothetical protein
MVVGAASRRGGVLEMTLVHLVSVEVGVLLAVSFVH